MNPPTQDKLQRGRIFLYIGSMQTEFLKQVLRLASALMLCLLPMSCGLGETGQTRIDLTSVITDEVTGETVSQRTEVKVVGSGLTGTMPLELGERLFINRGFEWRDGLLHVPPTDGETGPRPLLVWLHGGGGHARDAKKLFPFADEFGVVVLAVDSRHNTWDGIDSKFGPDVRFIQRALQRVMSVTAIDPKRIALGGASDGGTYALAIGRSNGRVFSHLIAVSPWWMSPPSPPEGKPPILVVHGRQDNVYPEWHSRRFIVPSLKEDGYDVSYFSYDGPHWVTEIAGRKILRWFAERSGSGGVAYSVSQGSSS
ncbi:MAG: alpha/beta hydrolase [Pseudomonadota bacterium]